MMRYVWFLLGLCLSSPTWALASGERAPGFTLPDVRGGQLTLGAAPGRWVYLDFWASWCGPCQRSFPWMQRLQQRYPRERLQVLAVSVDEDATAMADFLRSHRPDFTVLHDRDGQVAARYALLGMPSAYLIAPDGRVAYAHPGFKAGDEALLDARIHALLGR